MFDGICCLLFILNAGEVASRIRSRSNYFRLFGGLTPVMQSVVADVSKEVDRPKYLGRIMATFGLGFVIGPLIASFLSSFPTRQKIFFASFLPFTGFLLILFFSSETKKSYFIRRRTPSTDSSSLHGANSSGQSNSTSLEIFLLTLNGFALMYTFASETIYAMFIKDIYGYGEHTLSKLFAINGSLIGIFQIFFIKHLINLVGKHNTLALGNLMLLFIEGNRIKVILLTIHGPSETMKVVTYKMTKKMI